MKSRMFLSTFPKPMVSIIFIKGMEQPGYIRFPLLTPQNSTNTGFTEASPILRWWCSHLPSRPSFFVVTKRTYAGSYIYSSNMVQKVMVVRLRICHIHLMAMCEEAPQHLPVTFVTFLLPFYTSCRSTKVMTKIAKR
jgi:hypothetical protein